MVRTLRSFSLGLILLALGFSSPFAQSTPAPTGNPSDTPLPTTSSAAHPPQTNPGGSTPSGTGSGGTTPAGSAAGGTTSPATSPAPRNPLVNNTQLYSASMAALTELFVIAVLLENAFAVVFNWRVFLTYFSLRGVKTVIMVVSSVLIVWSFNIDVMAKLIAAYNSSPGAPVTPASTPFTLFITALILAGGSSGVNKIMTSLGFRSDRQGEIAPTPPLNKAWVSIRVKRNQANSEVLVKIKEIGPADANSPGPIAGIVAFKRPSLAGLLFPDVNRFPENGGHTVSPGVVYSISVESKDSQGNNITALGAEQYVFAPGAIVDLTVTL